MGLPDCHSRSHVQAAEQAAAQAADLDWTDEDTLVSGPRSADIERGARFEDVPAIGWVS